MSIQTMRERRNGLAIEARKLLDDTKDKTWTADNQLKYDNLTGEITDLDARITREQKLLDLAAEEKHAHREPADKKREATTDDIQMFDFWMRRGEKGMSAEQAAKFYATLSTGVGSEGAYTVPSEVSSSLIDALKDFGGMRRAATIIQTAQGNPLSYPTSDGTAEVGELLAEP
jgi:HK97 family phage major capsid protein